MGSKLLNSGLVFSIYKSKKQTPFEKLFEIFKELITHTSGDFEEAIEWLRELDNEYKLTDENYTIDDFIDDLLQKGFIKEEINQNNGSGDKSLTSKTEKLLREHALKQIFGKLKKSGQGNHKSRKSGQGEETTGELKAYQFGDSFEKISITESLKNAQFHSGFGDLSYHRMILLLKTPNIRPR